MTMTDETQPDLDAIRARLRRLHDDFHRWLDSPTMPAAAPLLVEALSLCMAAVTALIEARAEVAQLEQSIQQLADGIEQLAASGPPHEHTGCQ